MISSYLTPSPVKIEDEEGGDSFSGYPKLYVIGRSLFNNPIYLNHTMGVVKIMPYRYSFNNVYYKSVWVPNLCSANAIWCHGPIYEKSQDNGYMYKTATFEDIRTGSYTFGSVQNPGWSSIQINFGIAMADVPVVMATIRTSSRIIPVGFTVEVYDVTESGFGICLGVDTPNYETVGGITVNYVAIVRRI